jgi:peptidyl-prolyl cis-trans isomerase SurA
MTACAADLQSDQIVAVVNDQVITRLQLDNQESWLRQHSKQLPLPPKRIILEQMVDTELQLQAAKEAHLTIPDSVLEQFKDSYLDFETHREQLRKQLLVMQIQKHKLESDVHVDQKELQNGTSYPIRYCLETLAIPIPRDLRFKQETQKAQIQADAILKQIQAGKNLRQSISEIKTDLPVVLDSPVWKRAYDLPEAVFAELKDCPVGGVIGPFKIDDALHLMCLLEKQNEEQIDCLRIRHILIRPSSHSKQPGAKQQIHTLRKGLNNENFESIAKQHSQDLVSAKRGGDLGWILPEACDPEIQTQLLKLEPGQISQPFETSIGWHIMQNLERKPMPRQDALAQYAQGIIYQYKFNEALQKWLDQLRSKAYLKIMLEK